MEDTFTVRVDKVFGALGDAPSSAGGTSALWCLTDEEVERRQWNRNKDIPEEGEDAVESVTRTDLASDLNELSDYEEEEEEEETEEIDGVKKRRRNNSAGDTRVDEYLDVQSNIGRDCTLDYEEEEDKYDKVAVGTEHTDDRLYLRNAKYADYVIEEFSEYRELPSSFEIAAKDPRANHSAAMVRLREDAEAAGEFDALQLSDSSMTPNLDAEETGKEVDADNPKPILKRRENSIDTKSQKRVRFMVDPKSSTHENKQTFGTSDLTSKRLACNDKSVKEQGSDLPEFSAGIPDYVRNPSKYTRYTFDSSSDEMDEESNRKVYADFFHDLRKRNTDKLMEETSVEMPKSVVFTPKKKPGNESTPKSDSKLKIRENLENKRWSVDITAENTLESEISAMEEDEPGLAVGEGVRSSQKSGRRFRAKINVDVDDN